MYESKCSSKNSITINQEDDLFRVQTTRYLSENTQKETFIYM